MTLPIAITLAKEGTQITLTIEEAREIWGELNKLFAPPPTLHEPSPLPQWKIPDVICEVET